MLGGGMRQAGVIAAAGIVALKTMIGRLAEDHSNARRLASGLARIPGFTVPAHVQTNIVMFEIPPAIPPDEFLRRMESCGIKVGHRTASQFRAVTHRMVCADDIDEALSKIELAIR
jgi:threonine aldolase